MNNDLRKIQGLMRALVRQQEMTRALGSILIAIDWQKSITPVNRARVSQCINHYKTHFEMTNDLP